MKRIWITIVAMLSAPIFPEIASLKEGMKLSLNTFKPPMIDMNPVEVDPSLLLLDLLSVLYTTEIPPENLDTTTWCLEIKEKDVEKTLSPSYGEILNMSMVKERGFLACLRLSADYAEWEGILLR